MNKFNSKTTETAQYWLALLEGEPIDPRPVEEQQMELNLELGGGRIVKDYTGDKIRVRGPKGIDGLHYIDRPRFKKK